MKRTILKTFSLAVMTALSTGSIASAQTEPLGGGLGKGGEATLLVNGKPVAKGRIGKTQPLIFSADETADVGVDNQTPVAEGIGIGPETRFTGKINKVTVEVKPVK